MNGTAEEEEKRARASSWGKEGATLVIEDCEPLLFYLDSALVALGHTEQHLAANLAEAEAVWALHKDEIRHVILNYELPDGTSLEFASRILKERPKVNVIITTGYELNAVRDSCDNPKEVQFLQKPFHLSELQAVLGAPAGHSKVEAACGELAGANQVA